MKTRSVVKVVKAEPRLVVSVVDCAGEQDFNGRMRAILDKAEYARKMSEQRLNGIMTELAPYRFANCGAPFWRPSHEPIELKGRINLNDDMDTYLEDNEPWWLAVISKAFEQGELDIRFDSGSGALLYSHVVYRLNRLREWKKYRYAKRLDDFAKYCRDLIDSFELGLTDDILLVDKASFRAWILEIQRMKNFCKGIVKEMDK